MTGKISELANHLWVIVKDKDGNYKKTKNYARNECLRRNIWGFIMEVTIDDDWLRQNEHSSMGKLLFPNGVLNLRTGVFYSKDKYPFDPEIVFTYRMPQDFIYDTIDDDYMETIRKKLFLDTLGEEVGNYLLLQFARALAGDLAKQITFGIGFGNNGKSVLADAIRHAIGEYFGSFDAEDFAYNPGSSRDGGQKMRPFYLNRNKRILISNELGSSSVVSVDMIKKNSSGGDTLKGRLHGGNETEFVPQYMAFMFSNEFPRFNKIDEPTYERARVVDFKKKIVDNPIEEDELQKDSNIVNEIKEERFRSHLVALLCSEYFRFVENKKIEVIPQAVLIARNEWVGDSGEFNIVGKFLETFELTNNKEDYLTSESIKYWLSDQFRGTSMEKFGKQLKNYIKKTFGSACAIENKAKKLNGKITQVWIGIRRIPEEEEKPSTGNNPPLDASSDVTTVLVET